MSRDVRRGAALRELADAAEALRQAAGHDEPDALARALERRERAFARVAGDAPGPGEDAGPALRRVLESDREALDRVRARLAATGRELSAVRRARRAADRGRETREPARFVSRRA